MNKLGNYEDDKNICQNERLLLTNLAWEFDSVLPGYFERNRPEWEGVALPIIAPLPDAGSATRPRCGMNKKGPFIYAVCDGKGNVLYIGKSNEKMVTKRWIRPDRHSGKHYWSHGTTGKPNTAKPKTLERIAAHISQGKGNVRLMFVDHTTLYGAVVNRAKYLDLEVSLLAGLTDTEFNKQIEALLIEEFNPPWNTSRPRATALMKQCGHYWKEAQ